MDRKSVFTSFACILMVVLLLAVPAGAQTSSLPAPVSPTADIEAGAVNVSWLPPTTSNASLKIAGCASVLVAMNAIAKNFSQEYPSIELNISDGGNDAGFAQWIAGQIDIADASRKIKPAEEQNATAKGMNVTETKVGVESIAFIVHPGLNLGPLEPSQLKAIYSGSVSNWNQVGGPGPHRPSSSPAARKPLPVL